MQFVVFSRERYLDAFKSQGLSDHIVAGISRISSFLMCEEGRDL
jgi:hypothetical protein